MKGSCRGGRRISQCQWSLNSWRRRFVFSFLLLLSLVVFVSLFLSTISTIVVVADAATDNNNDNVIEDLYELLGVSRTATTKEIKQAYRRKALDTHPDKNKNIPPEEAAENFRKVVDAFEILSDTESRRRYDHTGHQQQNQQQQEQQQQYYYYHHHFHQRQERNQPPRNVRIAQSRLMVIRSFSQLQTAMVDLDESNNNDNNNNNKNSPLLLERNLLLCFYTHSMEQQVRMELYYPWPFAGMSSEDGIWWEDILQTAAVQYWRTTELSNFFQIPPPEQLTEPIFIFGRRGQASLQKSDGGDDNKHQHDNQNEPTQEDSNYHIIYDNDIDNNNNHKNFKTGWTKLQTQNRREFQTWVWDQLGVTVEFVNHHDHPVNLYWINGRSSKFIGTMEPNQNDTIRQVTRLSHEWCARDARFGIPGEVNDEGSGSRRNGNNNNNKSPFLMHTCMINWAITSDEPEQQFIVPLQSCQDLHVNCQYFAGTGRCKSSAQFMRQSCRKSCNLCQEQDYTTDETKKTKDQTNKAQYPGDEF